MFPTSEVKNDDICYLCNCMRGHCMEDDTKPTGYKKPQRKKNKGKEKAERKGCDALCVCITSRKA